MTLTSQACPSPNLTQTRALVYADKIEAGGSTQGDQPQQWGGQESGEGKKGSWLFWWGWDTGYAGQKAPWLLREAAQFFHGTLEAEAGVWCQLFKEATIDGESWPGLRAGCEVTRSSGQSPRLKVSSPHPRYKGLGCH